MNAIKSYYLLLICLPFCFWGCGDKKVITYPEPAEEAYDGAFVSKADTVLIGDTEYATDFGTLTVSENRQKPDSRFIHLPVMRIHSTSETPSEPVFRFTGGPGMSNVEHYGLMWYLLSDHDVVLVGFRGMDGSSTLDCPEVSAAMKGEGDLFSRESLEKIGQAWTASARRLNQEGVDLDGYNMLEVIQDNELARQALGYERINLKGTSYGSRVAYLYGLIHPESIHYSALVAVNPPGRFVWEPDMIDEQLRYFSDLWSKDPVMSLKSADLYADMETVLNDMPERWLFLPINKSKVKVVTFCLLWRCDTAAVVFDAYVAAARGDASGLALMSLAYDYVVPNLFNWGDLASKAVSADFDPERDYDSEMEPPDLPLGAPMSKLLWAPMKYGSWPTKPLPDEFRKLQYSDVETLLVSGSIDLGTPAQFAANDLLPHLKNGRQVVLSERGHMDIEWPNPENCRLLIKSFYQTGIPDTSLNRTIPMDFNVAWGFPRIAKLGLFAVASVGVALIVFLYWLIRKIRRRKV